jgi:hypothetical protein
MSIAFCTQLHIDDDMPVPCESSFQKFRGIAQKILLICYAISAANW